MKTIRFIDLFAGIGGMRLGFEKAAQKLEIKTHCVLSSEINADSCLVYEQNFGESPRGDIRSLEKLPPHDILLAGFPCQSFSFAGKQGGFKDKRGTLVFEIIRLIKLDPPQAFIFENVRGLLTNDGGETLKKIQQDMEAMGYSFEVFLLNSANFGLPQNRLRVYLLGVLNGCPQFKLCSDLGPKDSHAYNFQQLAGSDLKPKKVTVADILEEDAPENYNCSPQLIEALQKRLEGDLNRLHGMRLLDYRGGNSIHSWELGLRGECSPEERELMNRFILKRRHAQFGKDQDGKLLSQEQIATFFDSPELGSLLGSLVAKNYLKLIQGKYKPVAGNFSFEVYKFLDPNKIAVTLVASDGNRLGVYYQGRVRKITPREAARLQGFPDEFRLHPRADRAYYQLGNSVSINVVEAVAREVILNLTSGEPGFKYSADESRG
ncbi:DNA (cytosine-5-)-methyltransferase [Laspinema olomoucense]|uniref:Cytosine-specific methyltransferase n=1 Tax=Laspinema olomoucense D3b TaxID=2953688 RepID=A0ABT2N873_9CYAN|nr:DNA (cytosine-5-)-methyltransferase [Laspinema sp. D3b]MCT7978044.1 DNA (cytosine-5-)-methyltransferase [Laspinema sp. D3b]